MYENKCATKIVKQHNISYQLELQYFTTLLSLLILSTSMLILLKYDGMFQYNNHLKGEKIK